TFHFYQERPHRWAVIVAHRRAGKTVGVINDLVQRAIAPGLADKQYAYIAPTLVRAKDIAWKYLKDFSAWARVAPPHEGELRVDLVNGSRIRLYGADD